MSSDAEAALTSLDGVERARFFTARSALGARLEVVEVGERLCVRGELAPVPGDDYASYWGAELGLALSATEPSELAPASDGLDASGFSFLASGELPPQLRVRVGASGEVPLTSQYCQSVDVAEEGPREVLIESLTRECWLPGGAPFPEASRAALVSWQLPAGPEAPRTFDFCIEELRALP